MKKVVLYFISVIYSVIIFGSCAGMKIERGFQDNIFYSTRRPELKIRIGPDFKYLGGWDQDSLIVFKNVSFRASTILNKDVHLFVDTRQDNSVKRVLMIQMDHANEGQFKYQPLFPWMKFKLISGNTTIHGDSYQYAVEAFDSNYFFKRKGDTHKFRGYKIPQYFLDIINKNNNKIPQYFLVKALGRSEFDNLIRILYFEDLNYVSEKHRYSDWGVIDYFSDEQRAGLEAFIKRSEQAVQIVSSN